MKAIVIGATGATGKSLLPLLATSSEIESIDCFGRRHPDFTHQKLNSHQIDFLRLMIGAMKYRVMYCLPAWEQP